MTTINTHAYDPWAEARAEAIERERAREEHAARRARHVAEAERRRADREAADAAAWDHARGRGDVPPPSCPDPVGPEEAAGLLGLPAELVVELAPRRGVRWWRRADGSTRYSRADLESLRRRLDIEASMDTQEADWLRLDDFVQRFPFAAPGAVQGRLTQYGVRFRFAGEPPFRRATHVNAFDLARLPAVQPDNGQAARYVELMHLVAELEAMTPAAEGPGDGA